MIPPCSDPNIDFCTNRHSERQPSNDIPSLRTSKTSETSSASYRRSDFSFHDGNLAIITETPQREKIYYLVHQGVLFRHSPVIEKLVALESQENVSSVEGRTALYLDDSPEEMQLFLRALYDGMYAINVKSFFFDEPKSHHDRSSSLEYDANGFSKTSCLLVLFTKYNVARLRSEALEGLGQTWPMTLELWEHRESRATDISGVYLPRLLFPHPMSGSILFSVDVSWSLKTTDISLYLEWSSNSHAKSTHPNFSPPHSMTFLDSCLVKL
jgi:hypothetical protein